MRTQRKRIVSTTTAGLAALTMAVSFATPAGAGTAVSVKLVDPTPAEVVSGTTTFVSDGGTQSGFTPTKVTFSVDGTTVGTAANTIYGYVLNYDSTRVANGSHTVRAAAFGRNGRAYRSPSVTMTVSNVVVVAPPTPTPSTVTVGSPTAGSSVSGTVNLTTNGGVSSTYVPTSVTFKLDGASVGTASGSNGSYSLSWDSTKVANGTHSLVASSSDGTVSASSASVSFTVSNTVVTPPPPSSTSKMKLGIATGSPYVPSGMTTDQYWNSVQSLGVGWARTDAMPSSYTSYTSADGKAAQASRTGLKLIVTLTYGLGGVHQIPTTATERQQWADWAGNTARHLEAAYPGVVGAYEIWNEANNSVFAQVDPVVYTDLLKRSYTAIKSAVPAATVLTTGTSPGGGNGAAGTGTAANPADFVKGIYANGGKGYFDAVAHHPYETWYWQYINMNGGGYRATHWVRQVMNANGDSAKQIWGTEAGWPSCFKYPSSAPTGLANFTEDQRTSRFQGDMKDWFTAKHDPATGATTGYGTASDWNTGPFMIFKLYKESVDPGLGIIYASGSQCGMPDWYQPSLVSAIRTFTAS